MNDTPYSRIEQIIRILQLREEKVNSTVMGGKESVSIFTESEKAILKAELIRLVSMPLPSQTPVTTATA